MLESTGAVLVEGAKWCGKTQSSLQIANSVVFMQDPDEGPGYLAMADTKPSLLLEGNLHCFLMNGKWLRLSGMLYDLLLINEV
ncbi:MAG: hypothetical protein MZV63_67795 [Marinilabiliales bacterium]|nr:hypothetical protein [Marinilabiliales bacterium]